MWREHSFPVRKFRMAGSLSAFRTLEMFDGELIELEESGVLIVEGVEVEVVVEVIGTGAFLILASFLERITGGGGSIGIFSLKVLVQDVVTIESKWPTRGGNVGVKRIKVEVVRYVVTQAEAETMTGFKVETYEGQRGNDEVEQIV